MRTRRRNRSGPTGESPLTARVSCPAYRTQPNKNGGQPLESDTNIPGTQAPGPDAPGRTAGLQRAAQQPPPGYAIYEIKPISRSPELDFAVWIEGVGCFGIQVKGGQNTKDGPRWLLHTVDGTEEVPCPIQQTWDASLAIKTAVKRRLGRKTFVIPVLLFPDMLPDPEIERFVEADGRVNLMWGEEDLVNRLIALPETDKVYNPPDAGQIVAEVAAVRPALDFDAADAPDPEPRVRRTAGGQRNRFPVPHAAVWT